MRDLLHAFVRPERPAPNGTALEERLAMYIDYQGDGCWVWHGACNRKGYGNVRVGGTTGDRRMALVHRVVYTLLVGPIPDGLQIDHLCCNPPCCNPAHLEVVTSRVNTRRASAKHTMCIHGHEYTPENTYRQLGNGRRRCRTCNTERQRERRTRRDDLEQVA